MGGWGGGVMGRNQVYTLPFALRLSPFALHPLPNQLLRLMLNFSLKDSLTS